MKKPQAACGCILLSSLLQGCVAFTTRHDGNTTRRQPVEPRPLAPAEEQAVAACLAHIRACQLPDGAFAQVAPGDTLAAHVWVAPYFANTAALALLAAHARRANREDLARVRRWLDWCTQHQSADGCWHDFEGTATAYADTGAVDAWDSSAALYLRVAGRYRQVGGMTSPEIFAAALRALACIATVTDADGLTWAKPDYRVKFLMDNIEVCAGLRAAAEFFASGNYQEAAQQAREQADRIAKRLHDFQRPPSGVFAYALRADGTYAGGLEKPYPHGLAQLFGLAFVEAQPAVWEAVTRAFQPGTGPAASCGTEWWLIAASRVGGDVAQAWRAKVTQEVASFTPKNVYVSRPALAALGLLENADWMRK